MSTILKYLQDCQPCEQITFNLQLITIGLEL